MTAPASSLPLDRPPPDTTLTVTVTNLFGAVATYLYFTYLDPLTEITPDMTAFVVVVGAAFVVSLLASRRLFGPAVVWYERLRAGADPATVPPQVRRNALNAPLASGGVTLAGWVAAAVVFAMRQRLLAPHDPLRDAVRIFLGIALVGGVTTSALAFLVSEMTWRRRIPLFFPDGHLDHEGVLRLPILMRLGATFLLTAMVPLLVLLMLVVGMGGRLDALLPDDLHPLWTQFQRAHVYVVAVNAIAATVMALLVARFLNRPVQALREAMSRVAAGDLSARVPVRSTDELGELNERFNAMVAELGRGRQALELFGRYVSPEVARAALERGVELEGEVVHATAMFADLRGFTEISRRLPPEQVVKLLGAYYEVTEQACDEEHGTITQFLGDGLVVVFGGPLAPFEDHAERAVRAAVAVQRRLRERRRPDGEPIEAGIGICTGYMIAGNVPARARLIYTIVGDAVNQAARLQVKTRELGAAILLTESTYDRLPDPPPAPVRACGRVALRGILDEVRVYAVDA